MSLPIRRRRDGRYTVKLDHKARVVLASVAGQLPEALTARDPMVRRLFPPAYTGEGQERAESEYRTLVDAALENHHQAALRTLIDTAGAETLTADELHAWLDAVGSLRLVIGTRLDVSEEMVAPAPDSPAAAEYALYEFLGELQYVIVEVLAAELPEDGRPEGLL